MNNIVTLNPDKSITTTSMEVAKEFAKVNKHVIRAIRKIIKDGSIDCGGEPNFGLASQEQSFRYFRESTYLGDNGQQNTCFEMDKDGFVLLVMGFTGKIAIDKKIKYIERFNKMDEMLKNIIQLQLQPEFSAQEVIERKEVDDRILEIQENALKRRIKNRLEIADMLGQSFDINEFLTNEKSTLDPKVIMDMKLTMGKEIATYGTLDLERSSLGHLLELHSVDHTAQSFNADVLIPMGLLGGDRRVTGKGLYFGTNDKASSITGDTHPRWFDARFAELIEYVKGENLL